MNNTCPRIIVISGATRGLGKAMAQQFAEQGHSVLACGRNAKKVEQLQTAFGQAHDIDCVDVSSNDEVRTWAKRLLAQYGPPDLLINNAGVINKNAPLWKISEKEFSKVIDVNIKGSANMIRQFVPAMIEQGRGVIVNFSSGWGRSVSSEVAPYCASKWAIEGLTQALAEELPQGMAAIPLNPGIIDTEMLQSAFGPGAKAYPDANQWAKKAVPYLLKLGPQQNGKSLSVPY